MWLAQKTVSRNDNSMSPKRLPHAPRPSTLEYFRNRARFAAQRVREQAVCQGGRCRARAPDFHRSIGKGTVSLLDVLESSTRRAAFGMPENILERVRALRVRLGHVAPHAMPFVAPTQAAEARGHAGNGVEGLQRTALHLVLGGRSAQHLIERQQMPCRRFLFAEATHAAVGSCCGRPSCGRPTKRARVFSCRRNRGLPRLRQQAFEHNTSVSQALPPQAVWFAAKEKAPVVVVAQSQKVRHCNCLAARSPRSRQTL